MNNRFGKKLIAPYALGFFSRQCNWGLDLIMVVDFSIAPGKKSPSSCTMEIYNLGRSLLMVDRFIHPYAYPSSWLRN
jgi:hypothetical protein